MITCQLYYAYYIRYAFSIVYLCVLVLLLYDIVVLHMSEMNISFVLNATCDAYDGI